MGVFATGDCHGNWDRLIEFSNNFNLTKNDYIIVCGDFGIWDAGSKNESVKLDKLGCISPTILFVSGNHENFDRFYNDEFETVDFHGGKAQKIRDNIFHLLRGFVFNIEGKKFFAFGGASSHDISDGVLDPANFKSYYEFCETLYNWRKQNLNFRIKGISWWERELPTQKEMDRGRELLAKEGDEVDFIITHCCPYQIESVISYGTYKPDILTKYFDGILNDIKFTKWYFGHYHEDMKLWGKFVMLYDSFEQIV